METLLRHSDIALYQAKAAGRHCHQLFSPDMQVRASENLALEQAMRHGFGTEQFSMEYQPIVDLHTGRVCSLEALMRWRHPELGIIPPSQFIPVAEASGLNLEIGMFALRSVLEQLQAWMAAQVPLVPVAVNICPRHLESADFCEWVRRLCAEYHVEPRWLRFEITESALLKDPESLVGTLQRLREMGSQVLIDDFGTGYSGLAYLARLPVDTIKIDRSFIGGLNRDNAGQSIVGNLVEMARKLKMDTLAEGVESSEHASVLRELGCNFGQGYHFSKPMSARHCRKLLDSLGWEQALTATLVSRTLDSA
jgi:EAL domain-containing protein (putative c-di-GMP-specific phosphodiesterase class I)